MKIRNEIRRRISSSLLEFCRWNNNKINSHKFVRWKNKFSEKCTFLLLKRNKKENFSIKSSNVALFSCVVFCFERHKILLAKLENKKMKMAKNEENGCLISYIDFT